MQLPQRRINLDVLLQTWLTLNDDTGADDGVGSGLAFDPSRVPSIPLGPNTVDSLLSAVAWSPSVSVRTWVLTFQTLTLMANLKYSVESGEAVRSNRGSMAAGGAEAAGGATEMSSDRWLAAAMVADGNMTSVLRKFLSGASAQSSVASGLQNSHVCHFDVILKPLVVFVFFLF